MKVKIIGNRELKDGTLTAMIEIAPEDEDEFHAIRKQARSGKVVTLQVEETIKEDSRIDKVIKAITPIIQIQMESSYYDGIQEGYREATKEESEEKEKESL